MNGISTMIAAFIAESLRSAVTPMQEVTATLAVDAVTIPVRSAVDTEGSNVIWTPAEIPVTTNSTSGSRIGIYRCHHQQGSSNKQFLHFRLLRNTPNTG